MTNKYLYIILTIIAASVIHPVYNYDRLEQIRSNKIETAISSFSEALELYEIKKQESRAESTAAPEDKELVSMMAENSRPPAAVITSPVDRKIVFSFFDEKTIKTEKQAGELKTLFESGRAVPRGVLYGIKELFTENGEKSAELLVTEKKSDNKIVFAAYRVDLERRDILPLIFENLLVLSLIISGATLIYIVNSRKKQKQILKDEYRTEKRKNADAGTTIFNDYRDETPDSVKFDPLNKQIYKLFSKIHSLGGFEEVSLYIYNRPGRMNKVYELKGNRLIKIDGGTFNPISLNDSIIAQLKRVPFMLSGSGRTLEIPLKKLDSLIGIVRVNSLSSMTEKDVQALRAEIEDLIRPLNDLLNINEVMIDPETGLSSESYLYLRLFEIKEESDRKGQSIDIMIINLFDKNDKLTNEDKNKILKTLAPAVKDLLKGREHFIGRYADMICAILHGNSSETAETAASTIKKELARFRIKLDREHTVQIKPSIGISTLDNGVNYDEIFTRTAKKISSSG